MLALPASAASKDALARSVLHNNRAYARLTLRFSLPAASELSVIALSVPYPLSGEPPADLTAPAPLAFSFTFTEPSEALLAGLRWASNKHPVDIDVRVDLGSGDQGWESLEELVSKTVAGPGDSGPIPGLKPIVLCAYTRLGTHKIKLIEVPAYSQPASSSQRALDPDRQATCPPDVPRLPGPHRVPFL